MTTTTTTTTTHHVVRRDLERTAVCRYIPLHIVTYHVVRRELERSEHVALERVRAWRDECQLQHTVTYRYIHTCRFTKDRVVCLSNLLVMMRYDAW